MFDRALHRSARRPLAALAALTMTGALAGPAAATPRTGPVVPSTIAVESGHKVSLVGHAVGVQIYSCDPTPAGGYAWRLVAPRANLYDDHGKLLMTHFGGPSWQTRDGSTVVGARVDGANVDPTAIPWLLIKATSTTPGRLIGTKFIQRVATTGGLPPAASACDPDSVGTIEEIPYTADYFFWK